MKILYLAARPPYPPHKGDQLIAWEQIKQLKKQNYRIYFVSFISRSADQELIQKKLQPYCEDIYLLRLGRIRKLFNLLQTVVNFKPLQVNLFTNRKLKRLISKLYDRIQPDVVHVQTVRAAEYFLKKDVQKTVDMIDALSLNMLRRAKKERIHKRFILLCEHYLLKRYERRVLENYDQTFIVSKNDKSYLKDETITVNPNGTYMTPEYVAAYANKQKEKIILFHGNMQYYPNVEAAYTFVKEVWPTLHKQFPDYSFYIAGKDPVKKIEQLHGQNNVVVTGFVEDMGTILFTSLIGVYPMLSGTGMQNKVIEAMSCGLPVVASPLALQGIEPISSAEVLKYTTKQELVTHIGQLIKSEELRNKLSANGKRFVHQHYSWEKNCETLIRAWKKMM